MNLRLPVAVLFACLLLSSGLTRVSAEDASLGAGSKLETLTIAGTTYHQVVIRSVNAHTVVFTHSGGLASMHLRDLPPEWQARFHFNPSTEARPEPAPVLTAPAAPTAPTVVAGPAKKDVRFDTVLRQFGQPAEVKASVDLRPKFREYDLYVKDQGMRPDCAVFAVIGALEFQNAELKGKVERFSEEYLAWATRKETHNVANPGATEEEKTHKEDGDEGFSLSEVVDALRAYGVPHASSTRRTAPRQPGESDDPTPEVIEEARNHQHVFVHPVPGRDRATRINNIIQALNSGLPVPIGVSWPSFRAIRAGILDRQIPITGNGHAITLVGYTSDSGRMESTVFIFKNSYGADWGQAGYGKATYAFLSGNLEEAVLLEVQAD